VIEFYKKNNKGDSKMGAFKVVFSQTIPYIDPDYRSIYLDIAGEASVSCADREGSESDVQFVQTMIIAAIQEQISKYSNEFVSHKDLPAKANVMGQAVAAELGARNMTLNDFSITNIAPDEKSMQRINDVSKAQSFAAMTPQEQMKIMEEANRQAQESLSQLSAEQRRQAEEQAKKIMEQQAADMQKIMEQINQMKGAATGSTAAATAAIASAEPPKKKFCSNCGAPRGNGRFCPRCGKPLT
jgi:membrane protease subunit (stomatin/prohibitin family)